MANKASIASVRKFIEAEVKETEEALGFVVAEVAKASTDYGRVYSRKKAEYEGALEAYRSVLEHMDGGEEDKTE